MPANDSKGGAIGQYGELSLCTLLVDDCSLSTVLEAHSGDVHEGDRHTLPQLRDAVRYHAQ